MFALRNESSALRKRLCVAGVAGATLALVLSGCGASSPSSEKGTPTIRVIEANLHDPTILGAEAGNHLNIWSQCDPEVKVEITAGEKVAEAVAANSADIGIASPNRVIGGISQGLEATIIGASTPVWDQFLIVSANSKVKSFDELKGSTFGISSFGSAGHYATEKMARTEGWGKNDYKIVTMGSVDGIKAGLKSGTVDAFLWSAQTAFGMEDEGSGRVLGNVRELVGPNAMNVVFASNTFIKEHPDEVKAFAECYYKAVAKVQDGKKVATTLFVDKWGIDPKVASKVIEDELPLLSTDGKLSDDMLKGMLEATQFTIESAKSLSYDDVKAMYTYWKEL